MTVGQRIQERRIALRLTQDELAEMVLSTQRQISRYERNINHPSPELLAMFAQVLGVSSDYLLGLTDDPVRSVGGELDLDPLEREAIELLRSQNDDMRQRIVNAIRALV